MQAELAVRVASPAGRYPASLVAVRTARKAVRSGVLWGYVFGLSVASSALGYASTYKTLGQRAEVAALFGSDAGLAAINGPAREIQTVPGYTVWKSLMFLSIIGAVWGLLCGTRLLRGEEDAGRWELLLAGQTTRRRATAQALVGLASGLAALWAVTALITVVVGRSSKVHIPLGGTLFFALALVAAASVFLAAGALASQLAATRRRAAAYAGAALGASYALRMIADSSSGFEWLRWATPLGWVEQLQPLTSPRPFALLPICALTGLMAGLAVHLAGNRDLGASVLPDRVSARTHSSLLSGPAGLAVRLLRPAVLGWAAAIGALSLLMGFIAKRGATVLTSSPSIERVITRLGARGSGAVEYLGFTFLMVAVLVALVAAGQVTSARSEEAEGRLDHFLVRPVSRSSWLAGRVAIATAVLAACGILAGLCAWIGAASQSASVGGTSLLEAGVNVVAPALCILGIGVLVMGVWPRATGVATYGLLAWSLLVELFGGFSGSNHWMLDSSVFHQMASAPAVSPDWASWGAIVAIGLAATGIGGIALQRRDLAGE